MKKTNKRILCLQKKIKETELNGFVTLNKQNIRYLTGVSNLEGILLITGDDFLLFTNCCDIGEALRRLPKTKIKEIKRTDWSFLKKIITNKKIKKLGFEQNHLSLAEFKRLKKICRSDVLKGKTGFIEEIRAVKTPKETAKIKRAVSITEKILTEIKKVLYPGIRELEVYKDIQIRIASNGVVPAFEAIVAFGAHTGFPHAHAGPRRLKKNDLVLIDMGVSYDGYKSDLTRTFIFGKQDVKQKKIYDLVKEGQKIIEKKVKPGVSIAELEKIAHCFFESKKMGNFFPHSLGHGIGLEVHESPFFSKQSKQKLIPGMIFTLEPALYLPNWGGIRIEDMYLTGKNSCQKLSGLS